MKSWTENNGRDLHRIALSEDPRWRERISGGALDGVMRLLTSSSLLFTLRNDTRFMRTVNVMEKLQQQMRMETGVKLGMSIPARLRIAETHLSAVATMMMNHLSLENLKTVYQNCGEVNVTLSAVPVKMCDNVDHDDLRVIVKAATGLDNCEHCIRIGKEINDCPLRKALDTVPGMMQRGGKVFEGMCPYGGIEWSDEDA